jgi:hypothetical protein
VAREVEAQCRGARLGEERRARPADLAGVLGEAEGEIEQLELSRQAGGADVVADRGVGDRRPRQRARRDHRRHRRAHRVDQRDALPLRRRSERTARAVERELDAKTAGGGLHLAVEVGRLATRRFQRALAGRDAGERFDGEVLGGGRWQAEQLGRQPGPSRLTAEDHPRALADQRRRRSAEPAVALRHVDREDRAGEHRLGPRQRRPRPGGAAAAAAEGDRPRADDTDDRDQPADPSPPTERRPPARARGHPRRRGRLGATVARRGGGGDLVGRRPVVGARDLGQARRRGGAEGHRQGVDRGDRRREPSPWIRRGRAREPAVEARRELDPEGAGPHRGWLTRPVDDPQSEGDRVEVLRLDPVAAPDQERVGDEPERVAIGGRRDPSAPKLLGRHEGRRPGDPGGVARARAEHLGDPQVQHLEARGLTCSGVEEQVRRLEIAVDHACRVHAIERDRELTEVVDDLGCRARPQARRALRQALAHQALHHQVRVTTLGLDPGVDDVDQIGAVDPPAQAGLEREALAKLGLLDEVSVQHLQRARPSQQGVLDLVDRAHPTTTEHGPDPISAREQLTGLHPWATRDTAAGYQGHRPNGTWSLGHAKRSERTTGRRETWT